MLTDIIPAAWRKGIYAAYALVIVALGAVQVGFVTAQIGQPKWLTVALATAAYLGVAIGAMAASNTPAAAPRHAVDPVSGDGTPPPPTLS